MKELTVAIHVIQSSSNESSNSVADSAKCKKTKVNIYALNYQANVELYVGLGVRHQHDVKLGGFRSKLEVSSVSSHTEEL